jgi:hypothetical protein
LLEVQQIAGFTGLFREPVLGVRALKGLVQFRNPKEYDKSMQGSPESHLNVV